MQVHVENAPVTAPTGLKVLGYDAKVGEVCLSEYFVTITSI